MLKNGILTEDTHFQIFHFFSYGWGIRGLCHEKYRYINSRIWCGGIAANLSVSSRSGDSGSLHNWLPFTSLDSYLQPSRIQLAVVCAPGFCAGVAEPTESLETVHFNVNALESQQAILSSPHLSLGPLRMRSGKLRISFFALLQFFFPTADDL